jgi:hypothetical protein
MEQIVITVAKTDNIFLIALRITELYVQPII